MCKDVFECQAGCKSYHGGEVRHHKDCVHYPESFTKMYDDAKKRIKELEEVMQDFILAYETVEPGTLAEFIDCIIKYADEFKQLLNK